MWQIPSRKEEHLHGATTQRQQGKQYCGAASYRHVVHEVTSCLSASHHSYPCVPLPPFITSGFDREDEWGFRALEPSRCCISSIALVLLKTGIVHHPGASGEKQVTIDYNQMATAQKLLLFWRKPAVRYLPFSPWVIAVWG
jgi:hypothetical protein